jgi:hypothetical protein
LSIILLLISYEMMEDCKRVPAGSALLLKLSGTVFSCYSVTPATAEGGNT